MLAAVDAWAQRVGRARACRAFGYSERTDRSRRQAAAGRLHRRPSQAKPREQHQPQPSRIPDQLRDHIAELLCSPRFRDQAPAQVYYQLLDEGSYVCSIRQMYRILEERGLVRERRRGHRRTTHHAPQVQASGPNEVWSWDISRLRGPHHRSWFYLYVVIDIFSRKIVAWTVDTAESTEVARTLVGTACDRNGISPQQLTLHSDRGAQMTSTSLAELLEDLGVTRSLSRPRVSNDNPYSEAGFKTVKYRHDYPDRFHSLEEVRSWMAPFVDWYNREHYHSGVGYQHPATLHGGQALETVQARQETLDAAYSVWPERFRNGPPRAARPPKEAWINKPVIATTP